MFHNVLDNSDHNVKMFKEHIYQFFHNLDLAHKLVKNATINEREKQNNYNELVKWLKQC